MNQSKKIAVPRILLLTLTVFTLSLIYPGGSSAAPWDDLLKKAEDIASDMVEDVLNDDDEKSDDEQEPVKEPEPAVENSSPDWQAEESAPPPAPASTPPPAAPTASTTPSTTAPASTTAKPAVTTPAAGVAGVANPAPGMNLTTVPYLLLQLKYQPAAVDDEQLLQLTRFQVDHDQRVYGQAGGVHSPVNKLENARKAYQDAVQKLEQADSQGAKYTAQRNVDFHRQSVERFERELSNTMRGVVFDRDDVEGRDSAFAARELAPKFRRHLEKLAAGLPNKYTLEFLHRAQAYTYDFDHGIIYNRGNTWLPCNPETGGPCLPKGSNTKGMGTHFFILGGNQVRTNQKNKQHNRFAEFEGYFVARPPEPPHVDPLNPNPYGYPISMIRAGNVKAPSMVAFDRDIAMLSMKMDTADAEALKGPPPLTKAEMMAGKVQVSPHDRKVRSVLSFTIQEVPQPKQQQRIVQVSLDRLEIYSPEEKVLLAKKGSDFPSGVALLAKAQAKEAEAESATAAAAQAAESQAAADETDRLESFDIVGLKLGMPLADADPIVRQRMTPTSEYRFKRAKDFMAFDRSLVYIRIEDRFEPPLLYSVSAPVNMSGEGCPTPGDQRYVKGFAEICIEGKKGEYWRTAIPEEVISLTIEQSPAGKDVVLGISRWLSLPENVDSEGIIESLKKKYGNPDSNKLHKKTYTLTWGACQTNTAALSNGRKRKEPQLVRGDAIPDQVRLWSKIPTSVVNTALLFGVDSPGTAKLEQCRPAVTAQLGPMGDPGGMMLTVSLTDYSRYQKVFRELVASDAGPKKETVDLAL